MDDNDYNKLASNIVIVVSGIYAYPNEGINVLIGDGEKEENKQLTTVILIQENNKNDHEFANETKYAYNFSHGIIRQK